MELFGIKFAPINVPLERRIQIVTVAGSMMMMLGGFIGVLSSIYLVLFTSWRWLTILYLIWMYVIDRKTPERGGRRSQWVRNWAWWKYANDYFPFKMELMPSVQLNPNKNYVFCGFPHGVLSASFVCAITGGFSDLFPLHTPNAAALNNFFQMPFFRELILAVGMCSSSANSINYLLGKPGGGNFVLIAIGGAAEALNSRPRQYRLVLKNRKGFVKLALKNGSPLVPIIAFGEPDLYEQVANPEGSLLRTVQEFVKKWTSVAPIIFTGRGFFQYSFGLLPRRLPLTMLVGRPVEVEKIETPTQRQIDDLHAKFVEELTQLFEGYEMVLLGIEFAPLSVSLERRLQTMAAAVWFFTMTSGCTFHLLSMYLIIFTPWRWLTMLYLLWLNTTDRKTSERGGRRSQWVRNWTCWTYLKNYYPFKAELMPFVRLDPKKNYIFCCFPHGLLCASQFCALATDTGGFPDLFPFHTIHPVTVKDYFATPFLRELIFALGMCDSSAASINYLLEKSDGGNIVGIMIGGAAEALNSRPGQYRLFLKNRKGFVKLALKNGSPLVPVISFGEPDLYDQVANAKGSLLRTVQDVVKKWIGFAPIIPIGRGFFQYSFGLLPRRAPLSTLVGRPIEVERIEAPTQRQIDDLHSKFVEELTELFEGQKHRYVQNAESVRLEIE